MIKILFILCVLYVPINTLVTIERSRATHRLQDKVDELNRDWYTYELDVSEYCEIFNDNDCWWVDL